MSGLRQHHAVNVHVCSLDSNYFVLSNRTAAERHIQSELAGVQHRKRLVERVSGLQGLFERVCFVVEKDATKAGGWAAGPENGPTSVFDSISSCIMERIYNGETTTLHFSFWARVLHVPHLFQLSVSLSLPLSLSVFLRVCVCLALYIH